MELFPHIVVPEVKKSLKKTKKSLVVENDTRPLFNEKATYLGYTINKLIQVAIGRRKPENRDHYGNKRVSTAGALLAQQFYGAFRRMVTDVTTNTRKALAAGNTVNILSWIKPSIITNAMCGAISANNWSFGGAAAKGISQVYEQFTYAACIANLRKIRAKMNADGSKVIAPRDLNSTQWMVVCPAETPEGKTAGLAKNQALSCIITIGTNPASVRSMVELTLGDRAAKHHPASLGWSKVFLNGVPIGTTDRPMVLVKTLVKERRRNNLPIETSIAYIPKQNEIQISTEAGRLCRPLFVVENGEILVTPDDVKDLVAGDMSWRELLAAGKIEILDKMEEENAIVALYPSDLEGRKKDAYAVTHCELHPSLMYGVGASLIQRPNSSQSPRITYHSSMNKQAVGLPFTNYKNQMCGSFHTMETLQCQLSATRATTILNADILPCTQNAMVAVMPREYNEEDSVEVNLDSVQRGIFVSYKWVAYYGEIKPEKHESFGVPTAENSDKFHGNPMFLSEEGFAVRGSVVRKGDILIGKLVENMASHDATSTMKRYTNASITYDHFWPSVVDSIQIGTTGEGYRYIRVMTCQRREPIVGDKLATCPSQKGTISQLVRAVDLPFNKDGIVPDLIINALAFPSRMTIGTLVETLTGKVVISTSPLHKATIATFGLGSDDTNVVAESDTTKDDKPSKKERYSSQRSKEFDDIFAHPAQKGCVDSTPFRKFDLNIIRQEMANYGCDCGDECMTDGTTGRQLRAMIFFGPISYQRLKHQSVDKMHARAKGGKTTLTRQPPDGRALGGGLRVGSHTSQSGYQRLRCSKSR
jgi:DNA-directed RNA polymerase II subunit RPB2